MIETIAFDGKVYAQIVRCGYEENGVHFVTSADSSLQLGVLRHKEGVEIRPHIHRSAIRRISEVQEVLHVAYGEVEADFYDAGGRNLGNVILNAGDTILLLAGGHGFKILKDCKMIEVKQGPYYGTRDDKEQLIVEQTTARASWGASGSS